MQSEALTMVPNLAQSEPPMITPTDWTFALLQFNEEGYSSDNPIVCSVNGGNGGARLGCTDPTAINYDPTATVDDGSCIYDNGNGGGGQAPVSGCTDPNAANYNPDATIDDGSCVYASPPPTPPNNTTRRTAPPMRRSTRSNTY